MIYNALPQYVLANEQSMANILKSIIAESMWVWTMSNDNGELQVLATTTIIEDPISNTRNYLVYSIFGDPNIKDGRDWELGLANIAADAKAKHCKSIIAYSQEPLAINLVNSLGGNTSTKLLVLEI